MSIDISMLISQQSCAFADVTSVASLLGEHDLLTAKVNHSTENEIKHRLRTTPGAKGAMSILERLVAYDKILIDEVGAESITVKITSNEFDDFLDTVPIPENVYKYAAESVHLLSVNPLFLDLERQTSSYLGHSYEYYFDRLQNIVYTIANTGTTVPRVKFYLALADWYQVPIMLSPGKDRLLREISDLSVTDALRDVKKIVDDTLMNSIQKPSEYFVTLPPLSECIVAKAKKKKISILESMIAVRNSRDAKKFRTWLRDLHSCQSAGTRAGLVEADRIMEELKKIVKVWAERKDLGVGVTHKRQKFGVGICTEVIRQRTGIDITLPSLEINFKDPILNPPRHFKFIASWYRI